MNQEKTVYASAALIAAARQIFNSKSFNVKITVSGTDINTDENFDHTFHFDQDCDQLRKFFEQWGTDQCALRMMHHASAMNELARETSS